MEKDAKKSPADIGAAMRADEVAALQREKHELEEQLAASAARQCPSCKATFERGEGHACMAKDKKPEEKPKPKPAEKPADKPEAATEEPKKEESIFDAFIGPDDD
jgi:hypothetical protein